MTGSYLTQDISVFDAPFFNLTKAEAAALDPQVRLLLESVFVALESAGLDTNMLSGRDDVGVFSAGSKSEYETRQFIDPYIASRYAATGSSMTMFANRVSYVWPIPDCPIGLWSALLDVS